MKIRGNQIKFTQLDFLSLLYPDICHDRSLSTAHQTNGRFFVLDGCEGCGKSTQIKMILEYLWQIGYPALGIRSPGESRLKQCIQIRNILLDRNCGRIVPRAEFFLFEADRVELCDKIINPELQKGHIVVCDRFNAATYAYQLHRNDIDVERYLMTDDDTTEGLKPDLYIYIDIDPIIGLNRNERIGKRDHFELQDLNFHQRVRRGFLDFFKHHYKGNYIIISGDNSIENIHQIIVDSIQPYLS